MNNFVKDQALWYYPGGVDKPAKVFYKGPTKSKEPVIRVWNHIGEFMAKDSVGLPEVYIFETLAEALVIRKYMLRLAHYKLQTSILQAAESLKSIECTIREENETNNA